ncbi:hypothetical protein P7C71_g4522, partial [Lecanoromycetidae sp. Uapishka_2]
MSLRSRSHSTLRHRSSERGNKLTKANPTSRGVSPAGTNRRVAKLNLYLQRSAKNSVEQLPIQQNAETAPTASRNSDIKRWDGNRRMTIKWDSVRRDPELWFPSGDCLIHFYERGHSRRGASLRVALSDIESCDCEPLLDRYLPNAVPEIPSPSSSDSDRFPDALDTFNEPSPPAKHEIYIPAPAHLSREDAFRYHLTTRNLFAWMYEKPLVGDRLGDALIAVLQRLNEWRPNEEQNLDDILAYIDNGGYTDFRDCPDHALAVLQFAEKFQLRELWTDAFVHCTGMWEQLDKSAEFELSHGKFGKIFGNKRAKLERRVAAANALCAATNPNEEEIVNCDLVREYLRFEKQWTMKEDPTVSCADARKVRWILVYAILQTLISVTRAPQEVRDTEGVSYALCCQIAGTPPWQTSNNVPKVKAVKEELKRLSLRETLIELGPDMDILSAKPKPLVVIPKGARTIPTTVSVPRRVSITSNLQVKSPQPIRTTSSDLLNQGFANVSPVEPNDATRLDLQAVSPIDHLNVSPLSQASDPTTPSTSESGTGKGGWSASSSEDDMDHKSVTGSDGASNYGDDEADDSPAKKGDSLKISLSKNNSFSSFRPGNHNPELDHFLRS